MLLGCGSRQRRDSHGDTPLQVAAHVVVRQVLVPLRSAVSNACDAAGPTGGGDDAATDATEEGNEALRYAVLALAWRWLPCGSGF